ncbi:ThuA domain-containing protein [Muricauda sp. JGD-17]|uniref:ThuA domain-containing protein n=1 Tax=Flagellimonas ochracea TaxID=2696472 RepID=A0A964TDK8_9FLAO|nr:ThuA domain-containing protein [Allomuricauda ochracea]NAY91531.1 ThuA domain-containing protein [Allomuricauda ochracea]
MKPNRLSILLIAFFAFQVNAQEKPTSLENDSVKMPELVMVFTKTAGYRHTSIEKGVRTLRELGRANGFVALQTESGEDFNDSNLKNYKLVVFLSTTMDVLEEEQQRAFEKYIKNGGSYLGIHAAADTEYDWTWYGKLVGGYFESHPNDPNVLDARIDVLRKDHSSTSHLNDTWSRSDEWYNYKNLNPNVTVLLNLDEKSYSGGTNGANHPIAWYHEFDGGRAYYTGGGHTEATFDEPAFRKHLLGAIQWCLKRDENN